MMGRKNSQIRYEMMTTQMMRKIYLKPLIKLALVANAIALVILVYRAYDLKADTVSFNSVGFTRKKVHHVDKILVVTYLRSGSTFLGDLLQQNPNTFYTFEPLNLLKVAVNRINESMIDDAIEILDGLYKCDANMFHLIQKRFYKSSRFKIAKFYDRLCKKDPEHCNQYMALRDACAECTLRVLKVVRLNLRHLAEMLTKSPTLASNSTVFVHSRRDPRGW